MTGEPARVWRPTRLGSVDRAACLEWSAPHGRTTSSPLPAGVDLAVTVGADRRCLGVWRAGRLIDCPTGAAIEPDARSAHCASCTAADRSSSVAADTRLDDPRPFAVYLAHHGDVVKVGITAVERGDARLLEQGALASVVLSTGTLLAARRSESMLGAALGLPDRVSTVRKRAARLRPATPAERTADLTALVERVHALPRWPPSGQLRRPVAIADLTVDYPLPPEGLAPRVAVRPLEPGASVVGRVACRIGADLYLDTSRLDISAGLVLLDTRLLAGWALARAPSHTPMTAGLYRLDRPERTAALF